MATPLEREITVLEALENSYLDRVTAASSKLRYISHEPEIKSILKDLLSAMMAADALNTLKHKERNGK